jgi:hypothetical protein
MAVRFTVNNEEMLQCLWRFFSLLQMYARDPVIILALCHSYNSWYIASMRRLSKLVPLQKIGCPRLGRVVTTIALTHTWNHFQVTPISLRFVLDGVDKFVFLCIPWFAAIDMFFEHTLGPAVMWG